jgi:hypothetical protein
LKWLKKGNEVIVSKRCLVNFSIGTKYKDRTWCDVVAMDACHLLLGRLWQYDRNVHHDGRKNTYSFLVDNVKLTLLPNPGDIHKPPKEVSQILLAKREFIREMPDTDPNRPHYRMSPKKHEELQRQVEKSLAKGHIWESLGPYTVLALLTPKNDETWRMCVDSHTINKNKVRYKFPISRLDDLLDQLNGATVFSKLDFGPIMEDVSMRAQGGFGLHNGFLFKGTQLCIPEGSRRLKIIKERHNEGHMWQDKTL